MAKEYIHKSVNFQTFPKSVATHGLVLQLAMVIAANHELISSEVHELSSDGVLAILRNDIQSLGFLVESSKATSGKIKVPVLYGLNGATAKTFDADGFHVGEGIVLEVEAGRAVTNYQFLKDLFQACTMQDAKHLVIAVRNSYKGKNDFTAVLGFFETLYASSRLSLPLTSVTVIGY